MSVLDNFTRGDTKSFTISIKKDGVVIDITGSTFTFTMKSKKTDSDADAALQSTGTITSALDGKVLFELTPIDTDIDVKSYYYDIQWVTAGGAVTTLVNDIIQVIQDITITTT